MVANAGVAAMLVRLFEVRHDPDRSGDRESAAAELVAAVRTALDEVESLDQDRILRSLLALVSATLRTSWYQRDADGRPRTYTAFKLDPHAIPDLPKPLPRFEILVYSPRVEGVHLRFGAVARGGLRWSDRPRGLPHRGARAGEGAGGQERRHRARRAPRAGSS